MGLHIQKFNQRVQNMNHSNGRELVLGAKEARDLHCEILDLLNQVADMEKKLNASAPQSTNINLDGGGFR